MKKVLLVAPYFYPKIGGMEKYALNVAQGLKETHGWKVVVVTSNHEETGYKEDTVHGIKVYRLPYWFKLSNTPINPLWFFQIGKIIKKEKPDIINGHSPVPFIADVALYESQDIPYVMTYHAGSMIKHSYPIDFLIKFYESVILNACFKKAKAIISYSQEFIKTYLASYKDKVEEIPPGIDTKEFVPATKTSPNTLTLIVRLFWRFWSFLQQKNLKLKKYMSFLKIQM
jgi:glycosyltransferase involved in cell wall biosynthesis